MSYFTTLEQVHRVRKIRRKKIKRQRIKNGLVSLLGLILLGLVLLFLPAPVTIKADTTTINIVEDVELKDNSPSLRRVILEKFEISEIPTGYTINTATLRVYREGGAGAETISISRTTNQTWMEEMAAAQFWDIYNNIDTTTTHTLVNGEDAYEYIDVTEIVTTEYDRGASNCSLLLWHSSYSLDEITGTADFVQNYYLTAPSSVSFDSKESLSENTRPILTVIYSSANTISVEYDFPTYSNQTAVIALEKVWNGTQLLYRFYLHPYEDLTNVSITQIPKSYSFNWINPNAPHEDTISSDGTLIFRDLYECAYEVCLNPQQDWHTLHIMMHNPDLVGLNWESFTIYLNNTRVPYPPAYELLGGYYEYYVSDYYSQTILSGNHTVYDSDPEDVYLDLEVPIYEVAFQNGDLAPYRVEITRNGITRERTAPPKGWVKAYLYGLATDVPYTVEIYNENSEQLMDWYTLNVPNYPFSKPLEYDDDEHRINWPSYDDQFVAVKQTVIKAVAGQNNILTLGFVGIIITIIVNRLGLLATIFRKPLFADRKTKR